MTSKNIERAFDINIVASFVEDKILVVLDKNYTAKKRNKIMNKFIKDLLDFASFITGENIEFSNLYLYAPTIKKILVEQYPDLKIQLLYSDEYRLLSDKEISDGINKYKILYGDKIIIKSVKKEMVKSLKKTR